MAALDRLVDALEAHGCRPVARGDRWEFFCPAHADGTNRAGEAKQGDKGAILHCHAGCDQVALITALNLSGPDLFDEPLTKRLDWDNPDERYPYRDLAGQTLYEVRRIGYGSAKEIRPFMGSGREAKMGLPLERVLYRLPDVASQVGNCAIAIVEGERDVDAAWRADVAATTNVGGAGKWRDSYSEELAALGAECVVVADDDEVGHRHAMDVLASLHRAHVVVDEQIRLPALGCKDFADHLANGHGIDDLRPFEAPLILVSPGLVRLSDVPLRRVEWLWEWRIPLGKITVIDGDPGLGKSLLTIDLAARMTNGRHAPDHGELVGGQVLLLSAEDDPGDTIRPRFEAAGGDSTRVLAFFAVHDAKGDRQPELPSDVGAIEAIVRDRGCKMVVIDPLMAYLGADTDSYRDQDVRRVLRQLHAMASRCHCAVVLVRHLTKSSDPKALYRGGGSIGIVGAARAGWMVAKDPKDDRRRIMAPTKSNLAPADKLTSLAYHLENTATDVPHIVWDGEVAGNADDLLRPPSKSDEAEDWLLEKLATGPAVVLELVAMAEVVGISRSTLYRTAKNLGVKAPTGSRSHGPGAVSMWQLP